MTTGRLQSVVRSAAGTRFHQSPIALVRSGTGQPHQDPVGLARGRVQNIHGESVVDLVAGTQQVGSFWQSPGCKWQSIYG